MSAEPTSYAPFLVYAAGVLAIAVFMIGFSFILGQRHRERSTDEPFESGILATGTARVRFTARFFLIAMFFVIFDLEAVFLFAWAIGARETGWVGYIEMLVFVLILLAALGYLWRVGALEFKGRIRQPSHQRSNR